jgi:DNA polymerase-1
MVDYQTLVGDAVDNVPGVDKVGPKTACQMAARIRLARCAGRRAAEVKGAVGENLRKALDWLPKGRELLTIRTDCDLEGTSPACRAGGIVIGGQDRGRAEGLLREVRLQGPGQAARATTCRPS